MGVIKIQEGFKMITEVKMYTITCDGCKARIGEFSDYSAFADENMIWEEADKYGWAEHGGNHYCPNCYILKESDDDDDGIVIPIKRNK